MLINMILMTIAHLSNFFQPYYNYNYEKNSINSNSSADIRALCNH